jgi:hypothetical protein
LGRRAAFEDPFAIFFMQRWGLLATGGIGSVVATTFDQVNPAFVANLAVAFCNIDHMRITVAFLALHHNNHPATNQA